MLYSSVFKIKTKALEAVSDGFDSYRGTRIYSWLVVYAVRVASKQRCIDHKLHIIIISI